MTDKASSSFLRIKYVNSNEKKKNNRYTAENEERKKLKTAR